MPWLTHRLTIPLLLATTLLTVRLFIVFPRLDLALTQAFFWGGQFIGNQGGIIYDLRMLFWNLSLLAVFVAIVAVSFGYTAAWPKRVLPIREWNIILWGFLLGPGLLVNAILKSLSGRSRPRDISQFGGEGYFTAVGQWYGICAADCSFVSGEASGTTAFCLAAVMVLEHHRKTIPEKTLRIVYGALGGILVFVLVQRIASGGHFVSDALLAALFTALVFAILARTWPQTPQSA